jgi:phosphatidylinositol 3-kinase
MPVRPDVLVTGVKGEKTIMFKSALAPILVCFNTAPSPSPSLSSSSSAAAAGDIAAVKSAVADAGARKETGAGGTYRVIFKSGDDLRQDQLIIQMINLMDSLLKAVNLDLCLTPYRVLATAATDGFVEFVPNSSTGRWCNCSFRRSFVFYLLFRVAL